MGEAGRAGLNRSPCRKDLMGDLEQQAKETPEKDARQVAQNRDRQFVRIQTESYMQRAATGKRIAGSGTQKSRMDFQCNSEFEAVKSKHENCKGNDTKMR